MTKNGLACVTALIVLSGCASGQVQRGALIGAASGLVAGGTVGVLISDKNLLGSRTDDNSGNIALPRGGTIAASLLVGTMLGAIVGAMVGHQRDDGYEQPQKPAQGAKPAASADDAQKQQARAPWLRGL
jgi:uncharacterized protein YcfJ